MDDLKDEPHSITIDILKKIQAEQARQADKLTQQSEVLLTHTTILEALVAGQTRLAEAIDKVANSAADISDAQSEHGAILGAHLTLLETLSRRIARLERKPAKVDA
jgi:hypothetical protein